MTLYTHTHTHTHTHTIDLTKKKIALIVVAVIIAIVAVIAVIIVNQPRDGKKIKEKKIYDPEIARAMTYDQVVEGEEATDSPYVNFDAFFLRDLDRDGNAERIRGTCRKIGEQDTLYIDFSVNTNGYLKDGKITINNDNFYLETVIPKEDENGTIKENAIGSNIKEILLRDVNNGTQKLLTGTIRSAINNTNNYSKVNTIVLTGTHVADDGTETPIEKVVNLNIDWYGEVRAELPRKINGNNFDYKEQSKDIDNIIDEEKSQINLEFDVLARETKKQLNISKFEMKLDIPQLNGYDPTSVEVKNSKFSYDETTRKLVIENIAETDEEGKIIKAAYTNMYEGNYYNKYNIKITYPLEAYETLGNETIEIRLPIEAYYEGFNNLNEEFINPYISNIAKDTIIVRFKKSTGTVSLARVTTGKYVLYPNYKYIVSKDKPTKIYNGIYTSENEEKDTYTTSWYAYVGTYSKEAGLTLKETADGEEQVSDVFTKKDGTDENMESITKNIGIYFSNAYSLLGKDGWIKVYDDETDELIETFTNDNWNKYTEANPYKYEVPVKHIRIETSNVINDKYFYVYNIKELDDEYIAEHYTKEEFDNLLYIKSTLAAYIGDELIRKDVHSANYEESISVASMDILNSQISTQLTQKNTQITIRADGDEKYNKEKWLNGIFLLKMPKDIINLKINSVKVNNSRVKIESYETYKENGEQFIKILTENENPETYDITVNLDLTPDPRIPTTYESLELYAINENCANYYFSSEDTYDINGNSNKQEIVNKYIAGLSLVSPSSLLTNQVAKEYNEEKDETIASQIALVSKSQKTATIEIGITNNYSNTISDIQILGKVPTQGNTYTITKEEMGSNFDSTMKNTGIAVPEEIQKNTEVYYSEKENPTRELTDEESGWTKEPEDWTKVKSFLIIINNYSLPQNKTYTFSYQIEIPEGLNYNQISYSHHGVYFSLDTNEGKYRTQTEPNKLGFMIAKQFDLEILKYQKDTDKLIPGITFAITDEETKESNTQVTDDEGKVLLKNLYAGRTYTVKEIKGPIQYDLSEEEIRFKTDGDASGELTTTLISGQLRNGTNLNTTLTETGYKVDFQVENQVRPSIKIVKSELGTDIKLEKVKYKITGKGISNPGRVLTTNIDGEAKIDGIYVNEEYTLEEIKAEGYYLSNPIKFSVEYVNNEYIAKIIEGETKEVTTTVENYIPTINLNIQNEKIPRYTLNITKVEKGNESKVLEGAKFKLIKGEKVLGEYISNINGQILIDNLYQYEENKGIDQTYILKEVQAPNGYAKIKDIIFKVQETEGTLKLQEELEGETTPKVYTVDETTINLIIPDTPSFKLTKVDGTTKELLPGVKFAIYNIDDNEIPARDSKGNIIGNKETINGKEYYTIITDENGEFKADLPEGLYKAVEVEAPVQYDIEDNVYYFGIGRNREGEQVPRISEEKYIWKLNDENYNPDDTALLMVDKVYDIIDSAQSVNGEITVLGIFNGIIDLENGQQLQSDSRNFYSFLIRYDNSGNIRWAKSINGSIVCMTSTNDDGIVIGGVITNIETEDSTSSSSSSQIGLGSYEENKIIKYDYNGDIQWEVSLEDKTITSITETNDGAIVVGGYFESLLEELVQLKNSEQLQNNGGTDGFIIKYDTNGTFLWGKNIGGDNYDIVCCINKAKDGGVLVGGYFTSENILLEDGTQLTTEDSDAGFIMKYDSDGNQKWGKAVEEGKMLENPPICVTNIIETNENEIIASIGTPGLINKRTRGLNRAYYYDGVLIKYNSDLEKVWQKDLRLTIIKDLKITNDGKIIIITNWGSNRPSENKTDVAMENENIIEFNEDGEIEWIKRMPIYLSSLEIMENDEILTTGRYPKTTELENGEQLKNMGFAMIKCKFQEEPIIESNIVDINNNNDTINVIAPMSNGSYITIAKINENVELENGETLTPVNENGNYALIKYNKKNKIEWSKILATYSEDEGSSQNIFDKINITEDNGYIVGGKFAGTIQLENGERIESEGVSSILIKYNKDNEIEWKKVFEDGNIQIGVCSNSEFVVLRNEVYTDTYELYKLTKYNNNAEEQWTKELKKEPHPNGGSFSLTTTPDNNIIIHGRSTPLTIDNEIQIQVPVSPGGAENIILVQFDSNGKIINYDNSYSGYNSFLTATKDGGYIIKIQKTISDSSTMTSKTINKLIKYNSIGKKEWEKDFESNVGVCAVSDGIIVLERKRNYMLLQQFIVYTKFLENGKAEWTYETVYGGKGFLGLGSIIESPTGDVFIGGIKYFDTPTSSGSTGGTLGKNAFMKLSIPHPVPEYNEIEAENYLKEFKITTSVQAIDGENGGTISGEGLEPYEKVTYDGTNEKEIKMIPKTNYEIIKVTVNDEEYPFETLEDGTFVMPQFTNITEDKEIVVTFVRKSNKITINKIDEDTGEPLKGIEFELTLEEIDEADIEEDTSTTDNTGLKILVQTDSEGKAITQIPFGTYTLRETQTPQGYEKIENAIKIKFTSDPANRVIIENENTTTAEIIENGEYLIGNRKLGKIIVHHYLKDREGKLTEIKLAEDQILEDKIGESYKTEPYISIDKYELQKDEYDQYIIPEDYEGTYELKEKEISYYYEEKQIPLIVHHYVENTMMPVPLATGEDAQDIEQSNYEGEVYTTTVIPNEELSNEYELSEMPENANGIYNGEVVEVTYYYRKIQRNVNITKYAEDGQTPLAGAKFTITKVENSVAEDAEPTIYTTDEKGKISVVLEAGEYEITEIEAPIGYIIPENATNTVTITRETTEENLEITNDKIKGKVIVHHYIKGLDTPIKLQDGTYAEDEKKQGYVGAMYATKAKENIANDYEYDSVVGQTSGEYIDGTIEVTYYYKELVDVDVMKKWNHTNNIYGKPASITIELYADGEKIQEAPMTAANKVEIEGELESEETWQYTFEKLPKYTDNGIEINYTISEKK